MLRIMKTAAFAMLCAGILSLPVIGCAAAAAASEETRPAEIPVLAEAAAPQETQEFTTGDSAKDSSDGETRNAKETVPEGGKEQGQRKKGNRASSEEKKILSESKTPGSKSGENGKKQQSGKKSGSSRSSKGGSKTTSAATGSAAKALTDAEKLTGGTYTATGNNESALTASGTVQANVSQATIIKSAGSASSADGANFTGINAAVRVYDSAGLTLTGCTIEASAPNATGVFAYEKGTVSMNDCTVTVSGGGAGGVQVAGGGTLYGRNLSVASASKAAIRSDRGGGVMVLDGGTYTSTGTDGCPAIYSTADITVKNAECISTSSRAVIIEGKNTVTLENSILSGNDQSTKAGSVKANVLLYQSASGDASVGTSVFTMTGGAMTSNSGAMFYCTNTASVINLKNAGLILSGDGTLLIVSAGRWGKDGKNGGNCTLNAENQILAGDISVDGISSLTMNLSEHSSYTGVIAGEGSIAVTLDASSAWMLTGDSYVSSLSGDLSGLNLNGYTLFVNGVALER